MTRKIFLDCGAWNGASAKFFRDNHPEADDFEIFCFEPLPENLEKLRKYNYNLFHDKHITIIEKAVWVEDIKLKFFKGMTESGTLFIEKRTGNVTPENNTAVDAIDFGQWIKDNLKKEDYIICKLNVEGAEYAILEHLEKLDMLGWVDKWYIQWHWDKIKLGKATHDKVKKLVPHYAWGAMLNKVEEFKSTL